MICRDNAFPGMSLYANINLSTAGGDVTTHKVTPGKPSKSASLYAGVLAKPPPVPEPTPIKEEAEQSAATEPEPEKTGTSGKKSLYHAKK